MPYQTPYLTSLGITATVIGIILGAYGMSQMIIRVPLGLMSDRRPAHKTMIAIGAACAGAASLLRGFSDTDSAFLIANLISGFASSTYISFTVLNSSYYRHEDLPKAMGTITAVNNAGMLIGFVTGMIAAETIGIRPLFFMSCFAGVIGFVISLFIKEEKKPLPKISYKELFSALKDRQLIIFAVLALILQMVNMSTAMAFTTQVAKDMGASNIEIGMSSVAYLGLSVVSSYFVGTRLAKKMGGRALMIICFVLVTLYLVLVPMIDSMLPLYFLQAMCGFGFGAIFALCMSSAMVNVPKEKKSTAMGFYQAVYGIGMTFGPMIVGAVKDSSGMDASFYFLAVCSAVGIIIAAIAYSKFFNKKKGI